MTSGYQPTEPMGVNERTKELLAEATPVPWQDNPRAYSASVTSLSAKTCVVGSMSKRDAALITHMVNIAAYDERDVLKAQVEALREAADVGPYDRICPSCGSKPGSPCYGNGPMAAPHEVR